MILARVLARALRQKRRPLPLTSTTLAATIGVQPSELDDALHAGSAGGGGAVVRVSDGGLMVGSVSAH